MNKTNVTKTVRELDPIVERQSKVMVVNEETVRCYKKALQFNDDLRKKLTLSFHCVSFFTRLFSKSVDQQQVVQNFKPAAGGEAWNRAIFRSWQKLPPRVSH